jgi:anti-anti-sigma factor
MEGFLIEMTHHPLDSQAVIFRMKGILYATTLPQADMAFLSAQVNQKSKIILDLSETHHISSGGWAFLITNLHRIRETGGDIHLAAMRPEVHDAFELLEYDKLFRLYPTVEDAQKEGLGTPLSLPNSGQN